MSRVSCLVSQMADVFDQILALLHPDRLLRDPRATGEGVRELLFSLYALAKKA